MNIPNVLSCLRFALIPLFMWRYLTAETPAQFWAAVGIIALSCLTDVLDGIIARRFHMETALGRILDPAADKFTQASVILSLAIRHRELWGYAAVLLMSWLLMFIGGAILLRGGVEITSAQWFGKLATVLFYLGTTSVILLPDFKILHLIVIGAVMCMMLFSFAMYIPEYLRLAKMKKSLSRKGE